MKTIFKSILSQDADDALVFDIDSITIEDITDFKEYHGLHISAVGYLDRTRVPVGIDIGFGDVVYPNAVKIDFPVMLDMDAPRVNAYSLESSIAEKLEAIIHNGYLNSRYKDFYDIYILSMKYSFSYDDLKNAVVETFTNRKTPITMESAAFHDDFINDPMHQTRWISFLLYKKINIQPFILTERPGSFKPVPLWCLLLICLIYVRPFGVSTTAIPFNKFFLVEVKHHLPYIIRYLNDRFTILIILLGNEHPGYRAKRNLISILIKTLALFAAF